MWWCRFSSKHAITKDWCRQTITRWCRVSPTRFIDDCSIVLWCRGKSDGILRWLQHDVVMPWEIQLDSLMIAGWCYRAGKIRLRLLMIGPALVGFSRAIARSAKRVILSVRPSRPGTDSSPAEIETPGFHRMIASVESLVSCEQISCRWVSIRLRRMF